MSVAETYYFGILTSIWFNIGEWKTVNFAAWKGGEIKVCNGLQVIMQEPFYNYLY